MKKSTFLIFSIFLFACPAFSQSLPTTVSYSRATQPALMLELPYNQDVSEGFIVANLKRTGYNPETKGKLFWKQNKQNGFYIFKDVSLEGISQPVTLYFKIDQKSRRQKDESIIYLMVSTVEGNFISSTSDEATYTVAKRFMDSFISQSAAYKLDLDVKAQEDAVSESEKKLSKLEETEKELTKKIEQLQHELKKNKSEQENQQKLIEHEKKKLIELKASAA